MLKTLFEVKTHKLLSVHVLGQRATEIIHTGQVRRFLGGSMEYFRDMVFKDPVRFRGKQVTRHRLSGHPAAQ